MSMKFGSLAGSEDQGQFERSIGALDYKAELVAIFLGSRVNFEFRSCIQVASSVS